MAKKKKRKLSRRQRQAAAVSGKSAKKPATPKGRAATKEREISVPPVAPLDPQAAITPEPTPTPDPEPATGPEPSHPRQTSPAVSAVFKPAKQSTEAVKAEQEHIGRDLKRLGVQLGIVAVIIAGLAVLNAQTDIVGDIGRELFKLWN